MTSIMDRKLINTLNMIKRITGQVIGAARKAMSKAGEPMAFVDVLSPRGAVATLIAVGDRAKRLSLAQEGDELDCIIEANQKGGDHFIKRFGDEIVAAKKERKEIPVAKRFDGPAITPKAIELRNKLNARGIQLVERDIDGRIRWREVPIEDAILYSGRWLERIDFCTQILGASEVTKRLKAAGGGLLSDLLDPKKKDAYKKCVSELVAEAQSKVQPKLEEVDYVPNENFVF